MFQLGERLGFALVGVAPAQQSDYVAEMKQWLADGKQGEMHYLANYQDKRVDPSELLPGAKSVICVADRYFESAVDGPIDGDTDDDVSLENNSEHRGPRGRVARYAWGDDYHKVMKKRLFDFADALRAAWPDADYKVTVDTAPVLEREHAARAGLGWVGKHTLLIHPRLGSWFLLGEIITTLDIEPSRESAFPSPLVEPTDHCGTCTRCIDACPTDCITPYSMNATRCISYLTIEHRGMIDASLHPSMDDWVAGCDICQAVCPHNSRAGEAGVDGADSVGSSDEPSIGRGIHPSYAPREHAAGFDLLAMLDWNVESRQRALQGSALKRIKLDMFKRNALIAAGNHLAKHDHAQLRQRITDVAMNAAESELVRGTAKQVIDRLSRTGMSL